MFPKVIKPKKIIYLDHAATTPIDSLVKKTMDPFFGDKFGNPSSLYQKGREAKLAVEESRKIIAQLINAKASEIIFTAGGTESINLAVFGVARMNTVKRGLNPHLITSLIEHHCVINSFKALEEEGHKTTLVGVGSDGIINIDALKKSVRPETVLISVMLANNEIGTLQPVVEIGKWLKGLNSQRQQKGLSRIFFHTDACQAAGFLGLNVEKLGVDLLSANGSKIYGPKQTGFLFIRNGVNLKPLIYGGGQEKDLRSGTENVPGIVGLTKAFELAQKNMIKDNLRLTGLRDYFIKTVLKAVPKATLNGHKQLRLPNNINLTFAGVEGEALMLYLDSYGVCVSTSSACSTGITEASHVLLALGHTEALAKSSIRITLGKSTKKADLDYVLKLLPPLVKELQKVSKLGI